MKSSRASTAGDELAEEGDESVAASASRGPCLFTVATAAAHRVFFCRLLRRQLEWGCSGLRRLAFLAARAVSCEPCWPPRLGSMPPATLAIATDAGSQMAVCVRVENFAAPLDRVSPKAVLLETM